MVYGAIPSLLRYNKPVECRSKMFGYLPNFQPCEKFTTRRVAEKFRQLTKLKGMPLFPQCFKTKNVVVIEQQKVLGQVYPPD